MNNQNENRERLYPYLAIVRNHPDSEKNSTEADNTLRLQFLITQIIRPLLFLRLEMKSP